MKNVLICAAFVLASTSAHADTFEGGWDRPGFDYNNFELISPRAILCQWSCQKERYKCKAWTYVKPGVQGVNARCWLKFVVPRAVPNPNCTSGIMN